MSEGLMKLIDNIQKIAGDTISAAFQLERLEYLASRSSFFALVYGELILHLNYCIVQSEDAHNKHAFNGVMEPAIEIAGFHFPLTVSGRRAGMAKAFEHAANQVNDATGLDNLRTLMLSMDTVIDLVKAGLTAAQGGQQYMGLPPGYGVQPSFKLKKQKKTS